MLRTTYISKQIPIQERPKAVDLYDVKFYAVTRENIDEFLQTFERENGNTVFFAISVPDYENLSLNIAELRRYINQQKSLIIYYEDSARSLEDVPEPTEEVQEQ